MRMEGVGERSVLFSHGGDECSFTFNLAAIENIYFCFRSLQPTEYSTLLLFIFFLFAALIILVDFPNQEWLVMSSFLLNCLLPISMS